MYIFTFSGSDVQCGEEVGGPGVLHVSSRVARWKLGKLTQRCLLQEAEAGAQRQAEAVGSR